MDNNIKIISDKNFQSSCFKLEIQNRILKLKIQIRKLKSKIEFDIDISKSIC